MAATAVQCLSHQLDYSATKNFDRGLPTNPLTLCSRWGKVAFHCLGRRSMPACEGAYPIGNSACCIGKHSLQSSKGRPALEPSLESVALKPWTRCLGLTRRRCSTSMADTGSGSSAEEAAPSSSQRDMTVLFVEMGVGYDQHGQDITSAAVKACKNAITSNSIPAFRTGAIPGVSWGEMKLKVVLGVPREAAHELDIPKVKAIFPYGDIIDVEVKDGGLVCSSGVAIEALGDKNDQCYVVNAAVYVGY